MIRYTHSLPAPTSPPMQIDNRRATMSPVAVPGSVSLRQPAVGSGLLLPSQVNNPVFPSASIDVPVAPAPTSFTLLPNSPIPGALLNSGSPVTGAFLNSPLVGNGSSPLTSSLLQGGSSPLAAPLVGGGNSPLAAPLVGGGNSPLLAPLVGGGNSPLTAPLLGGGNSPLLGGGNSPLLGGGNSPLTSPLLGGASTSLGLGGSLKAPVDPVVLPSAVLDNPWALAPRSASPLNAPAHLTDGFPDPMTVEAQRMQYNHGLDDQLKQYALVLAQRHQATLDFLRAKNDQQKKHTNAMIDQQVIQEQLELETKCSEQLRLLAQAASQRKVELDKQANVLTLDYRIKSVQEELLAQDYEVHRRYFEAKSRTGIADGMNLAMPETNGFNGVPPMVPQPNAFNGMPPFMPSPNGFPNGLPQGFPNGLPQGLPHGMPSRFPYGLPNGSFGNGSSGMPPMRPYDHEAYPGMFPSDSRYQGCQASAPAAGRLCIVIHAAHNLKNLDTGLMGDYSDPYVMVVLGRQKHKTPVIQNNLDPVWTKDNKFTFNVGERDDSLQIEVFNSNYLNDDTLGTTSVDLRGLPPGRWHQMKKRLANGANAEIEFDVRFDPAQDTMNQGYFPQGPQESSQSHEPMYDRSRRSAGAQGYPRSSSQYGSQSQNNNAPQSQRQRSPSTNESNSQNVPNTYIRAPARDGANANAASHSLYLVIHAGHNLVNLDTGIMGDYSDPYVIAKVGNQQVKTPTINNNLNPKWDTKNQFSFQLNEADNNQLELEVKNSNFITDGSLGTTSVQIRDLPIGQWQRLRQPLEGVNEGELEFDVRYEPLEAPGYRNQQGPYNQPSFNRQPGPMPFNQ